MNSLSFSMKVRLANEMRATVDRSSGTITDTFVYTTHAWLLSLFFDCPSGIGLECPDDAAVAELDAAIRQGDVTWHAGPFNSQVCALCEFQQASFVHTHQCFTFQVLKLSLFSERSVRSPLLKSS